LLQLSVEHAASMLQSTSDSQQASGMFYKCPLQTRNKRLAQLAQQAVCEAQETLNWFSQQIYFGVVMT